MALTITIDLEKLELPEAWVAIYLYGRAQGLDEREITRRLKGLLAELQEQAAQQKEKDEANNG